MGQLADVSVSETSEDIAGPSVSQLELRVVSWKGDGFVIFFVYDILCVH